MPVVIAEPLSMSDEQRVALERMARSLPHRKVVQARALLMAADGVATNEVARQCGTTADSVQSWLLTRQRTPSVPQPVTSGLAE